MTSGFDQFIKHTMAMRELSHDAVINRYWMDIDSISSHGFLPFQLEGNFVWKPEGTLAKHGDVELINAYFDPVGKHVLSNPVAMYRQRSAMYVINGKLHRSFISEDATAAKRGLEGAVADIALLTSLFSCYLSTAIEWSPARYLPVRHWTVAPPENQGTSAPDSVRYQFFSMSRFDVPSTPLIDAQIINSLLRKYTELQKATAASVKKTILKALNWYRSGMSQKSPLNRILNVIQSLESLAGDTYKCLPPSVKRKADASSTEDNILKKMRDLTKDNCVEKVKEAYFDLNAPARDKCWAIVRWLYNEEELPEEFSQKLREFLRTRGRIAHGAIHDSDPADLESVRGQDWDIQAFVREILVRAIDRAPELSKLMAPR